MMHCTMWGTVYIYEGKVRHLHQVQDPLTILTGEEIGMINIPTSWPLDEWKDVATQNRLAE